MENIYRLGCVSSDKKGEMNYKILHSPLSEDWMNEMRLETKVLWDLNSVHTPWWGAHDNYNELCRFLEDYKQDLTIGREMHLVSETCQNAMKKISQLVTNCIVSFTTFITTCEIYVKKIFSDEVDICKVWNEKRNLLHKNSFSYRLAYELRNYSQHYALPVTGIGVIMTRDAIKDLEVYVDTAILKSSGYNWNKFSNDDDFNCSQPIDFLNILKDYLECVNNIYRNTIDLHKVRLKSCSSFFEVIVNKLQLDSAQHPVIYFGGNRKSKISSLGKEFLPLYLFNNLKKDWLNILGYRVGN